MLPYWLLKKTQDRDPNHYILSSSSNCSLLEHHQDSQIIKSKHIRVNEFIYIIYFGVYMRILMMLQLQSVAYTSKQVCFDYITYYAHSSNSSMHRSLRSADSQEVFSWIKSEDLWYVFFLSSWEISWYPLEWSRFPKILNLLIRISFSLDVD